MTNHLSASLTTLAALDPVMAELIRIHGPCTLKEDLTCPPYQALMRAIAHQQLHAKAAETILKRFYSLFPLKKVPKPEALASVTDEQLRSCGFSFAKIAALRDIAAKTLDGTIPGSRQIKKLSDEEIIQRLIQVRGVGRWTVEMLLIFKLCRTDVLPVDDFGVRNGFRVAYKKRTMPTPKELARFGHRWAPVRTFAAWYLWRAADASKTKQST
jgi:DNA-3-methyladenine glycosylase II